MESGDDRAREDCLTVSIRTPTTGRAARLPVLVYIHGGSNAAGDAGAMDTDGIHRAGIVLVRIQYRLGVFGFLGLSDLRREDSARGSGNYALLDQIAALRWVRDNIASCGGDPANVTLTGNSAGATDALFLTLSPLTHGLFRRAIVQASAPGAPITARQNERAGTVLLDRLGMSHDAAGLKALRAMPADRILAAAANLPTPHRVDPSFRWEQQIVDGHVLPLPWRRGPTRHRDPDRQQPAGTGGRSSTGRGGGDDRIGVRPSCGHRGLNGST